MDWGRGDGRYRAESDKLMETKMLILQEEKEEFSKVNADLQAQQTQLLEERSNQAKDHEAREIQMCARAPILLIRLGLRV